MPTHRAIIANLASLNQLIFRLSKLYYKIGSCTNYILMLLSCAVVLSLLLGNLLIPDSDQSGRTTDNKMTSIKKIHQFLLFFKLKRNSK